MTNTTQKPAPSGFHIQARICPICIDDHSDNRECHVKDLKDRIEELEAALEKVWRTIEEDFFLVYDTSSKFADYTNVAQKFRELYQEKEAFKGAE